MRELLGEGVAVGVKGPEVTVAVRSSGGALVASGRTGVVTGGGVMLLVGAGVAGRRGSVSEGVVVGMGVGVGVGAKVRASVSRSGVPLAVAVGTSVS